MHTCLAPLSREVASHFGLRVFPLLRLLELNHLELAAANPVNDQESLFHIFAEIICQCQLRFQGH